MQTHFLSDPKSIASQLVYQLKKQDTPPGNSDASYKVVDSQHVLLTSNWLGNGLTDHMPIPGKAARFEILAAPSLKISISLSPFQSKSSPDRPSESQQKGILKIKYVKILEVLRKKHSGKKGWIRFLSVNYRLPLSANGAVSGKSSDRIFAFWAIRSIHLSSSKH